MNDIENSDIMKKPQQRSPDPVKKSVINYDREALAATRLTDSTNGLFDVNGGKSKADQDKELDMFFADEGLKTKPENKKDNLMIMSPEPEKRSRVRIPERS